MSLSTTTISERVCEKEGSRVGRRDNQETLPHRPYRRPMGANRSADTSLRPSRAVARVASTPARWSTPSSTTSSGPVASSGGTTCPTSSRPGARGITTTAAGASTGPGEKSSTTPPCANGSGLRKRAARPPPARPYHRLPKREDHRKRGRPRGYDGGGKKQVTGRKRHIVVVVVVVDTLGLVLAVGWSTQGTSRIVTGRSCSSGGFWAGCSPRPPEADLQADGEPTDGGELWWSSG